MNMLNQTAKDIVVEVKDVHKSFKEVHAVRGINLRIHKGEFVALLGPNGAGKTTIVEMIEGIQKPDRGEIFILGKEWKNNGEELQRNIGISLQETRFVDKLNVEETLQLFASFYDLDKTRVDEVIALIDLEEKRTAYTVNLSGGQRQKLALGISLLNKPKILLLDEPTTGLDPNARREIWAILLKLKEEAGTSLILTTHYMEEAEQLCDYIIIIDNGQVLKEGKADDLLEKTSGQKIIEFTLENSYANETSSIFADKTGIKWDNKNLHGTIIIKDFESELPEFLNYIKGKNLQLKNFVSRVKTLDDLFISLTGRHLDE